MGEDWRESARVALARGPAALVSVLATEGSAPREAGARMVISPTESWGSIGGGNLEFTAIAQARAALTRPPGSWAVQDYPLGPLLGQCCGGRVRLLIEHLDPAACGFLAEPAGESLITELEEHRVHRAYGVGQAAYLPSARGDKPGAGARFIESLAAPAPPVLLCGGGHVGQAIARALEGLPFALHWLDSRADLPAAPGLRHCPPEEMAARLANAPAETVALILTHDHGLDYRLVAAALGGAAGFVGLIGSATKRARFLTRLRAEGLDSSRLVCPIGLPGISGKEPAIIAVAVAAQLLGLRSATSFSKAGPELDKR